MWSSRPSCCWKTNRTTCSSFAAPSKKAHIGNPIIAFATAEQARRYLKESRALPVLFILDVNLTGGESGIAFLRWLRERRSPLGSTPAMMLTVSESPADQDEAAMLGSIYFLHKPVTEQAITAAVDSLRCVVTTLS